MADDPKPTPETPPPAETKGPDIVKDIEGLLSRHGGSDGALRVLLAENYDHRDKARKLTEQLPPAGSLVLKGDEAKLWQAYTSLGNPDDVRKAIEDGKALAAEASQLRFAETVRDAADLCGYKPGVLKKLAEGLQITFAESKGADGKAVREAHIKGEGEATTPLTKYAEQHWGEFLPSLKAAEARGFTPGTPPRRAGNPAPPVTHGEPRRARPIF